MITPPSKVTTPAKITPVIDAPELPADMSASTEIAAQVARVVGASPGDVVVDRIEVTSNGMGAWLTVQIYAPVTTPALVEGPAGLCRRCRQPFSPSHDPNAEGPTVTHGFEPQPVPVTRGLTDRQAGDISAALRRGVDGGDVVGGIDLASGALAHEQVGPARTLRPRRAVERPDGGAGASS